MSIVSAESLSLFFGSRQVLDGCQFQVADEDRIGVVGPNGSGKSTLLRLIAGLETPNGGRISRTRSFRLAYVGQRPELSGNAPVYQEIMEAFASLRALEDELLAAGEALASASPDDAALRRRYEDLSHRFEHAGGYHYEADARRTLLGVGIRPEQWTQLSGNLSGGEQARVALAKAILLRPDLLLLDEPTNHLDLAGLSWLENLLATWKGAMLVVSHDRFFLDQLAAQIWEVIDGRVVRYRGNFSAYARQRDERRRREQTLYQEQQESIARQEELIRRYGAGQRAKWAKGLEKRLDRLERVQAPQAAAEMRLGLGSSARGGRVVLSLDAVTVARPGTGEPLLTLPARLHVERGARVAIIGSNGCGKTTLLRTITGELAPADGSVHLGHGIRYAYHRQGMENLDEDASVIGELAADAAISNQEARDLLARLLFRGDEVEKPVGVLSGGERSRLALAKLSIEKANLLLLDEPTNHLDISAREALEDILRDFEGTILFVSHDRRFIDTLATALWLIEDGTLRAVSGNYSSYLSARANQPPKSPIPRARMAPVKRPKSVAAELARHEEDAAELDRRLTEIRECLATASEQQDAADVARLGRLYVETEAALNAALVAWEEATRMQAVR